MAGGTGLAEVCVSNCDFILVIMTVGMGSDRRRVFSLQMQTWQMLDSIEAQWSRCVLVLRTRSYLSHGDTPTYAATASAHH